MSEATVEDCNCIIQTKDGPVRGYIDRQDDGTYYRFKSIPYAKPPIGNLRFMPPQPVTPWTEELDCTKVSPVPISIGRGIKVTGSEDCLYLEVITPNIQPDKPMPVMFWMSSYGFAFLLEEIYDPALLNNEGVIYVRCNARVGPFGFLSINDITAPGNAGLKDLVLGLKWVQRNIGAFGGDPNNVTIFGTSSGGSMVHFMLLSQMAAGLFHKAIIQSASALNNWSIDKNPTATVAAMANRMGIQTTCMISIVEELKSRSKDEIMSAFYEMVNEQFVNNDSYLDAVFKPCIEVEFEGQQAFITKSPLLIIKSKKINKVPIIIGSNNMEAMVMEYVYDDCYNYEKIKKDVGRLLPKPLGRDNKLAKVIGQKMLNFYFGGEEFLNEDSKNQYLQLVSDFFFQYYVNTTVKLHATFAPDCPIYYYIMTYSGEWNLPKDLKFFNCVGHHGEIPFIFRISPIPGSPPCQGTRDSVKTRSRVVRMWTNFAKFGNPTPDEDDPLLQIKWDPVENENKLNYLCIGAELTKGRNPFNDRMKFWDDLHKQHAMLKVFCLFQDLGLVF